MNMQELHDFMRFMIALCTPPQVCYQPMPWIGRKTTVIDKNGNPRQRVVFYYVKHTKDGERIKI